MSTFGSNIDDDADTCDADVPYNVIAVNGTEERNAEQKASLKRKAVRADGSKIGVEDCSTSKEDQRCRTEHSSTQSTLLSPTSSGISKEFPQSAVNRHVKDETRSSNGQVQCELKRYVLRKRVPCHVNSEPQPEVARRKQEEKKIRKMDNDDDDGTMDNRNHLTHVKPKLNTTLTPDHCLVLKQPTCCMCGSLFSSTADCIMHWRRDHIVTDPWGNAKPQLACQECPVRFAIPATRVGSDLHVGVQVARWLNHAVSLHNFAIPSAVEKFICAEPGCNFVALTPASYETHRQKNRHGGVTGCGTSALLYFKFCCFLCPDAEGDREIFSSKPELREHVIKKHIQRDQVREVLLCPVCKAKRPLTWSTVDDGDRCRPSSCRRFFYVLYRLLHHLVSKHGWSVPDYVQSFPCKFLGCRYTAVTRSDLDSHSISHDAGDGSNGSQNPSLPCEKCGKLVKFRAMRSHLRLCQVSLKDRQTQQCPYCHTRLSSQYNLRYHIKAVHLGTNTSKDFLCSYCTYSCHHKSSLEEHIFHRHGSNVSRRSVAACSLCPFKTIKQAALRHHALLVHNDAKTFRCLVCDKMFKCQCG